MLLGAVNKQTTAVFWRFAWRIDLIVNPAAQVLDSIEKKTQYGNFNSKIKLGNLGHLGCSCFYCPLTEGFLRSVNTMPLSLSLHLWTKSRTQSSSGGARAAQHTGIHNLITCFICRNLFLNQSSWGRKKASSWAGVHTSVSCCSAAARSSDSTPLHMLPRSSRRSLTTV